MTEPRNPGPRPGLDETAMAVAYAWARRSTCLRRAVGCVLLDATGRTLSTGHNGVARGLPHCNEMRMEGRDFGQFGKDPSARKPSWMAPTYPHACAGALAPSGTSVDACGAVHAEQNAVLACADTRTIRTCYCTTQPCTPCVKLLLNTGCERIVFCETYPDEEAKRLWTGAQRSWQQIELPDLMEIAKRCAR